MAELEVVGLRREITNFRDKYYLILKECEGNTELYIRVKGKDYAKVSRILMEEII